MKHLKKIAAVLFIIVSLNISQVVGQQRYDATLESLNSRPIPEWFNQAKFGIFLVWGPYSVPAFGDVSQGGVGGELYAEWYGARIGSNGVTGQYHKKTYGDDVTYLDFAKQFRAEHYDPQKWVNIFKKAGAKYVFMTANFHDGYCLWPSSYSKQKNSEKWNSMEIGPKRNLLGDLFDAGHNAGMKMGIYYSLYEWWHPLWLTDRERFVTEHYIPQFKEVVTEYKPWFIFTDGQWEMSLEKWKGPEVLQWLFNDSPVKNEIVVNDRFGGPWRTHGSIFSSEYGGGNLGPDHPWAEDRGIGKSYGYNKMETEEHYDSTYELIKMMTQVCSNGGNYTLAIGPKGDGTLDEIQVQRLLGIGNWLEKNGDAIYASKASPFWPAKFDWGTITSKPGKLFCHVHGNDNSEINFPKIKNKIKRVYALSTKEKIPYKVGRGGIKLQLAGTLEEEEVSVYVVEFKDDKVIISDSKQKTDKNKKELKALSAKIIGDSPKLIDQPGANQYIGKWQNPEDYITWEFKVSKTAKYKVMVTFSCKTGHEGGKYTLFVGNTKLEGWTAPTGSWTTYKTVELGVVTLKKKSEYELSIKPESVPEWKGIGIKSVEIERIR